jgi:hypothetical protein
MKTCLNVLLAILFIPIVSGCSLSHHIIGKAVHYEQEKICQWEVLPTYCEIPSEHFTFQFHLKHLETGEFEIAGNAIVAEANKTLNDIGSGAFSFLLLYKGIVVDAVDVTPRGDLWDEIPFRKTFSSEEEFHAVAVGYRMTIPL